MALRTFPEWKTLLTEKILLPEEDADTYAKALADKGFDQNGMTCLARASITDAINVFTGFGIKSGHCLVLISHFQSLAVTSMPTSSQSSMQQTQMTSRVGTVGARKMPPMPSPSANLDMSMQEFRKFCFDWKAY